MNSRQEAQSASGGEIAQLAIQIDRLDGDWISSLRSLVELASDTAQQRSAVAAGLACTNSSSPGRVYLAMLHASLMEASGHVKAALNSWNLASRAHTGRLDALALEVLGLGSEEKFRARAAHMQSQRARYLHGSYERLKQSHGRAATFRVERALAGYLGEAAVFSSHPTQKPKVLYVPGLGTGGFLDPSSHPLVPALRQAYPQIRADFERALSDGAALEPFLGVSTSEVPHGYVSGGPRAAWDAVFFFRHGHRYEASHRLFPDTGRVLDSLDLCKIGGQSPEVCFSVLQPGSKIEPHHGVTNARVVIHLPLNVPQGCRLELTDVGEHHWVEGEPMVFDDTFEHSATNPSEKPRGILLMDAWHPGLTTVERDAFRRLVEAISSIEQDRMLPGDQSDEHH